MMALLEGRHRWCGTWLLCGPHVVACARCAGGHTHSERLDRLLPAVFRAESDLLHGSPDRSRQVRREVTTRVLAAVPLAGLPRDSSTVGSAITTTAHGATRGVAAGLCDRCRERPARRSVARAARFRPGHLPAGALTMSSSSTSKTSVAPGLILGGAPRSL